MNMRKKKLVTVCVVLAASMVLSASAQTNVYDNTLIGNYKGRFVPLPSGKVEFGDEITLGAGPRTLSALKIEVYSVGLGGGETATVNLYRNDGTYLSPNFVPLGSGTDLIGNGFTTLTYTDPALTLPNTLIWTVSFSGVAGSEQAGLPVYNPPTVGSSFNDFWTKDGSGTWTLFNPSQYVGNFAARVTAVPEAGTIAYGLLGGMMVVGYLRLRRK